MERVVTTLLDVLGLLLIATGLGLLAAAAVAWSSGPASVGAGLVVAGAVVTVGSVVASRRLAGGGDPP